MALSFMGNMFNSTRTDATVSCMDSLINKTTSTCATGNDDSQTMTDISLVFSDLDCDNISVANQTLSASAACALHSTTNELVSNTVAQFAEHNMGVGTAQAGVNFDDNTSYAAETTLSSKLQKFLKNTCTTGNAKAQLENSTSAIFSDVQCDNLAAMNQKMTDQTKCQVISLTKLLNNNNIKQTTGSYSGFSMGSIGMIILYGLVFVGIGTAVFLVVMHKAHKKATTRRMATLVKQSRHALGPASIQLASMTAARAAAVPPPTAAAAAAAALPPPSAPPLSSVASALLKEGERAAMGALTRPTKA